MEEELEELRERLEKAAKLVEHLPGDLRAVAFSKAFESLVGGDTQKRSRGRKTGASRKSVRKSAAIASSAASAAKNQSSGAKARRSGARMGAQAAIQELIADQFFKTRRTLPQIQDHLRTKRVLQFKQSELSSPLAFLTRKGELEREKNDDGAFEYWRADK